MYNRLLEIRKEKGVTQDKCAKIAKISKKSYERYESGERLVPAFVIERLCKYYNVSADYILELIDEYRELE